MKAGNYFTEKRTVNSETAKLFGFEFEQLFCSSVMLRMIVEKNDF